MPSPSSRGNEPPELILLARGRPWKPRGVRLGILQPGAGVVQHDPVAGFEESGNQELPGRGHAGRPLRSRVDALIGSQLDAGFEHFVVAYRDGRSAALADPLDRKSTRLNSSHLVISYAVF